MGPLLIAAEKQRIRSSLTVRRRCFNEAAAERGGKRLVAVEVVAGGVLASMGPPLNAAEEAGSCLCRHLPR